MVVAARHLLNLAFGEGWNGGEFVQVKHRQVLNAQLAVKVRAAHMNLAVLVNHDCVVVATGDPLGSPTLEAGNEARQQSILADTEGQLALLILAEGPHVGFAFLELVD